MSRAPHTSYRRSLYSLLLVTQAVVALPATAQVQADAQSLKPLALQEGATVRVASRSGTTTSGRFVSSPETPSPCAPSHRTPRQLTPCCSREISAASSAAPRIVIPSPAWG